MIYSSSTASKEPHRFPANYPKQFIKGSGAYLYDDKDNKYFDFLCSLGAISLGYRYHEIDEAVKKAITDYGTIFSLSHPMETELAELLSELIPTAEMARFFHNGKDPNEVAIRLARHITGRELILSNSYHGCSDVFMCITEVDNGVPQNLKQTITDFNYGDKTRIKGLFDRYEIAAIIMEPCTTESPDKDFLPFIRDICSQKGALLIFDEVVTFPRMPSYSAQSFYGVYPDLTAVGKGAGNGYAWSALCGLEKYMKELKDGGVFGSTTHGGNLVGVSATIATLRKFQKDNVSEKLNALGKQFREGIKKNDIFGIHGPVDSRLFFDFKNEEDRWKLYQETIKRGLFFSLPILFSYSMTKDDIDKACQKINKIIDKWGQIEVDGPMPSMVFKRYDKKKM